MFLFSFEKGADPPKMTRADREASSSGGSTVGAGGFSRTPPRVDSASDVGSQAAAAGGEPGVGGVAREGALVAVPGRSRSFRLATAWPHRQEHRYYWQVVVQLGAPGGVAHYPWSQWPARHTPMEQVVVVTGRAVIESHALSLSCLRRLRGSLCWHAVFCSRRTTPCLWKTPTLWACRRSSKIA